MLMYASLFSALFMFVSTASATDRNSRVVVPTSAGQESGMTKDEWRARTTDLLNTLNEELQTCDSLKPKSGTRADGTPFDDGVDPQNSEPFNACQAAARSKYNAAKEALDQQYHSEARDAEAKATQARQAEKAALNAYVKDRTKANIDNYYQAREAARAAQSAAYKAQEEEEKRIRDLNTRAQEAEENSRRAHYQAQNQAQHEAIMHEMDVPKKKYDEQHRERMSQMKDNANRARQESEAMLHEGQNDRRVLPLNTPSTQRGTPMTAREVYAARKHVKYQVAMTSASTQSDAGTDGNISHLKSCDGFGSVPGLTPVQASSGESLCKRELGQGKDSDKLCVLQKNTIDVQPRPNGNARVSISYSEAGCLESSSGVSNARGGATYSPKRHQLEQGSVEKRTTGFESDPLSWGISSDSSARLVRVGRYDGTIDRQGNEAGNTLRVDIGTLESGASATGSIGRKGVDSGYGATAGAYIVKGSATQHISRSVENPLDLNERISVTAHVREEAAVGAGAQVNFGAKKSGIGTTLGAGGNLSTEIEVERKRKESKINGSPAGESSATITDSTSTSTTGKSLGGRTMSNQVPATSIKLDESSGSSDRRSQRTNITNSFSTDSGTGNVSGPSLLMPAASSSSPVSPAGSNGDSLQQFRSDLSTHTPTVSPYSSLSIPHSSTSGGNAPTKRMITARAFSQ